MRQVTGAILILAALLVAGCGGSGSGGASSSGSSTTAPSPTSPLAGTWKATKAEFVSIANSAQRVELVSLGTSLTLTLDGTGTYTQKIVDPGQVGQTTTGTWTSSSDVLALKPTGMTWEIQFNLKLSGTTLALDGGHVAFDVNQDGKDEETLAYFNLVKQ